MAFARINGVLLHYRLHGSQGAPVLALVNSLGTDARIWDAMIAAFGERYRVLSYDKRGHGLSDAPEGDYSLDDHLDDLSGLLDHLGIARLALCGVSVGGLIAQGFALRHPRRLSALVLCDTAPHIGSEALWNERIATARTAGLVAMADAVMARWFPDGFRSERAEEVAGWRNLFLRNPVSGYAGTCATLRDTDLRDAVAAIATPTLVVVGEHDASTPVDLVRDAAGRIPGARFEIVAGAGHIPSIDRPDVLAGLVQGFLKDAGHG